MINDTIVGISTAPGSGGIGIIRLTGYEAITIADKVFNGMKDKSLQELKSHTIHYGHIYNEANEVVDEVLVMLMKAPHTYTKEDVVEINCHGGIIVLQKMLELLLRKGARLAEPGEFTKRAFLNGRIDLSQAEAVIDIINSKTDLALKTSVNQLEGSINKKVKEIRGQLLETIAHIEASIDYPEYDMEQLTAKKVRTNTQEIKNHIQMLLDTADTGRIIKEGIRTVIIGKPNVGKSSLMNALLKEQRAIVTEIPGTTRDILEEYVNIGGIPLRIVDTAGIRETEDRVEKIGVKRSKEQVESSELIIFVLDISRPISEEDYAIMELIKDKKAIIVLNKKDLQKNLDIEPVRQLVPKGVFVEISAKEERGLDDFEAILKDMFMLGNINVNENTYITNVRHKDALVKAVDSLNNVIESINAGMPEDCFAIDLKACYEYLGEVTGDSVSESIIDQIFSQFCLGK